MDAKEYLNQVYLLDLQIQNKVDQVARMRARVVDVRRALGVDRVQNNGPVSTMEDSVIRILEEEAEINREIDRLVDLKKEIRETIGQVGDVIQRMILEKRHLNFEKWEAIQVEMKLSRSWVYKMYHLALAEVQQILDRDCQTEKD
jgi:exoribonuclease II